MATVHISPIFNSYSNFGTSLALLAGGTLRTFQAGTSTPIATYTDSTGTTQNPVQIAIGPDGRLQDGGGSPTNVWLVQGQAYKFVLYDSGGVAVGAPYDNIYGVNDPTQGTTVPTIQGYANLPSTTAGGSANALTATFSPAVVPTDKLSVFIRAAAANTLAVTLDIGTGAKNVVKGSNTALVANDIAGAGYWMLLTYDGTLGKWVLDNPATGVFVPPSASNIGVQGTRKNLKTNADGLLQNVNITADELVLETGGGALYKASTVNVTINLLASGANGLDAGSVAASTEYYAYVIYNGVTVAGLASLSSTSPTLPGGYTYFARVGAFFTDGSKVPLCYYSFDNQFWYKVDVTHATNVTHLPLIASGATGNVTTPTWTTQALTGFIPVTANAATIVAGSTGSGSLIVSTNSDYGGHASATNPPQYAYAGTAQNNYVYLPLESTNIYWASSAASCYLRAFGWVDNL